MISIGIPNGSSINLSCIFLMMLDNPEIKSGANYEAWRVSPLPSTPKPTVDKLLNHLPEVAVLAPSSHNTQPWSFKVDLPSQAVNVYLDRDYVLPVSDRLGREAYISIGCALTNMAVAARYLGYTPEVAYLAGDVTADNLLARVSIAAASARPAGLAWYHEIFDRSMHRAEFDGRPLDPKVLNQLEHRSRRPGVEVSVITDTQIKGEIADLVADGNSAVLMDGSFRKELGQFIMPNDTTEKRGMPGDTFGLDDQATLALKSALLIDGRFDAQWSAGFAMADKQAILTASAIAVITSAADDPVRWLQVGEVFEEVALIAQKQGLGVSISTSAIEDPYANNFLKSLVGRAKRQPMMFFRMGYPKAQIPPHSPRLSTQDVIHR